MLVRHIVRYLPSQIIPAVTALIALTVYTRLLSPESYGYYTLMINGHMLLNVVWFGWLTGVVLRLVPNAAREGYTDALRAVSSLAFAALAALLLLMVVTFQWLYPHSNFGWIVWFAFGLGVARSLLSMLECWHRGALHIQRHNLLECGQAVIGLAVSITLIYFFHLGALGAASGLLCGLVCMLLVDRHEIARLRRRHFQMPVLRNILHMGVPLIASNMLVFILTSSDRFLIEYFDDTSAVGIYAAGYSLVDRIIQVLFIGIAMPSYSLTLHRLEHEGVAAAREQTYRNGIGILALALPACVGLIFCTPQLATVVIGEEFREGALRIMPVITLATLCNGLTAHYFDHAFLFAKKTHLLLFTQGPSAALNVALNLMLIPRYGPIGAAYATLAAYVLLLTLSITLGRRAFAIHFPFKPALQITASVGVMGVALAIFTFPLNLLGLIAMASLGVGVYGVALLAFNVEGTRSTARMVVNFAKQRVV